MSAKEDKDMFAPIFLLSYLFQQQPRILDYRSRSQRSLFSVIHSTMDVGMDAVCVVAF